MTKETLDFLKDKTMQLINAKSCCAEAKQAAQTWLDNEGDEASLKAYITELEEDIIPVASLVAFSKSEKAKQIFGDGQAAFEAHASELLASGAKYCDCPACAAAEAILSKKDEYFI